MQSEQIRRGDMNYFGRKVAVITGAASAAIAGAMSPREVAYKVFDAIKSNRFYIITHPESKTMIQSRMEDILKEKNPASPQTRA
jgi:hypothetical protein